MSPVFQKSQKINKLQRGTKSMSNLRSKSQFSRPLLPAIPKRRLSKAEENNLIGNLLFKGQQNMKNNGKEKLTKTTFNLNKI